MLNKELVVHSFCIIFQSLDIIVRYVAGEKRRYDPEIDTLLNSINIMLRLWRNMQ